MKKKTYLKRIALSVVLLCVLALAVIYVWSTIILNKTYPVPLAAVHIPDDATSAREGARLVRIEHCGDCHGDQLTGGVFRDMDPHIATLVAPNLTQVIPTYSNEEIKRVLRYGVKKDGHSVFIMPVPMYHQLSEESVANIIAYLRSMPTLPATAGVLAQSSFTFSGRLKLIKGEITPTAGWDEINIPRMYIPEDTTEVTIGRYLVMTACTACHGKDLKRFTGFSPDLIIASAYNKKAFFKLLRTGVALGDRENIGLMSDVAKSYLRYLNDKEISSIYAYLKTKPTIEKNQISKNETTTENHKK